MSIEVDSVISDLSKSRLQELWWVVFTKLYPIIMHFKGNLNYVFTTIQKQANSNLKVTQKEEDKFSDRIISSYVSMIHDLTDITVKRVIGEWGYSIKVDEKVETLVKEYISLYIKDVSNFVISDIFNNLKMAAEQFAGNEVKYKEYINYYFNKVCKSKRSKLLSINEVYRFHNFLYIRLMSSLGYNFKVRILDQMHSEKRNLVNFEITQIYEGKEDKVSNNGGSMGEYPIYVAC